MSSPELSVVCKSCGSEVSPYVTECPYCGTRLRKRAPKLERHGDEFMAKERKPRRRRAPGKPRLGAMDRPYATLIAILGPAVLFLVQLAADLRIDEVGAIIGSVGSEWWRYLAAPFVYDDLGYLFVVCVALAIFVPSLERRLGTIPALILLVACGALGMLAADALDSLEPGVVLVAAGGNGVALGAVAAWAVLRDREARADPGDDFDLIGVAVIAVVLLALPLVDTTASIVAGIAGGLVGAAAGFAAARANPGRAG
jgi:membrane associated rhomboid family serine protease